MFQDGPAESFRHRAFDMLKPSVQTGTPSSEGEKFQRVEHTAICLDQQSSTHDMCRLDAFCMRVISEIQILDSTFVDDNHDCCICAESAFLAKSSRNIPGPSRMFAFSSR